MKKNVRSPVMDLVSQVWDDSVGIYFNGVSMSLPFVLHCGSTGAYVRLLFDEELLANRLSH